MNRLLPLSLLFLLAGPWARADQNDHFIGKIIPSDADSQDHFGSSVAVWEDLSVVGAPNANAVYVYREEHNGSMTKIAKLTSSDGGSNTQFGGSVSLSDGIIAVGAKWSDQHGQPKSGAAYLYQVLPDWSVHFLHKVTAHDANNQDYFGSSVSFSQGILAVGAPSDDHSGRNDAGSAYVYRLEHNGSLSPLEKLTASDANASDNFGHSVSTSHGLVAVGAPSHNHDGATYLYWQEENGSFLQIAKVTDPDANYASGGEGDGFGHAVSLAGDLLAVSTIGEDVASVAYDVGAVYLFRIEEGMPHLLDEVLAPISDMHNSARFGYSLALSYELLAVGAQNHNHGGHYQAGATYLYRIEHNGTAGLIEKFVADDANASDKFGTSVALSYDNLAVGAHKTDYSGNTNAGTVYYFDSWAAANRAPVDIRPEPFLGFSPQKEWLLYDLQAGWLKSAESLVVDAYGLEVDPSDDWNLTIHEHGSPSSHPVHASFTGAPDGSIDLTKLEFNLPLLVPIIHDEPELIPHAVAWETLRMLHAKNCYYLDVTGDGASSGNWFKTGLADFLVGYDGQVLLILGTEPTVSEVGALLALLGIPEASETEGQRAASYLAVRYLDFKIRQSGQNEGIKHMTSWMKTQFDNGAGAAASGINAYFAATGLGYANAQAFINDFKGAEGRNFVQNEIVPKLDNLDAGSVLGGDVTGGPPLRWDWVVPSLHGPPQSNVQYEVDEWANFLEFEEESPVGTVVGRFEAVDLDPHLPGWKGYELINHGANISWSDAKAAADAADAADPFHWVYLATITSEAEHNLTKALVAQAGLNAWLGANDAAVEGEWRWTEGPEGEEGEEHSGQGLLFWVGAANGNSFNGLFSNWSSIEPNPTYSSQGDWLRYKDNGEWDDSSMNASVPAFLLESDQVLTHVYSLVSGAGDEHNHLFVLADDGALFTGAEFDYENNASSYSIRVRVIDELNASREEIFTIRLLDVDEDPDKDGLHNNEDLDDDGDGYSDVEEIVAGSDSRNGWSLPPVSKVIYVREGAGGDGNGTSWASAYDNLQAALAEADGINRTQIWLTSGVYRPDVGPGQTEGQRNSTFQLKNRLEILGGFQGHEEGLEDRVLQGFGTYLSGDVGAHNWPGDNVRHVVTASGVDRTAVLADLAIVRGQADGPGEWDKRGAGILAAAGSPSLRNLGFFDNHAEGTNGGGGALCVYDGGSPQVFSTIFQSNSAQWGGAVKLSMGSSAVFYNTLFLGNQAENGGAVVVWESNASIIHSTMVENNASTGGGIYVGSNSIVAFDNSIAWDNQASQEPSGYVNQSFFVADHSVIQGGHGDLPDADPLFADPANHDFRLRVGSPFVDEGNPAKVGALPVDYGGAPRNLDAGPDLGLFEGAVDAVNLSGTITYSGEVDTGPFRVWLMDQSGMKVKQMEMEAAGPYSFVVERGHGYMVKAFRDAANDGWPSVGDPWDYHLHYPIEINEPRNDFDVHLSDAVPDQNATVSGEVFYEGPVPGPVIVAALDQADLLVDIRLLPEGPGDFAFSLPKGKIYQFLAFRDGNGNGELDNEWQVGEPSSMHGDWNETTQTFNTFVFVGGDMADVDIVLADGDHDEDGLTDWEEHLTRPVDPLDDLVAEYYLEGNAFDDSGNGNHGMVAGPAPAQDRFGEEGMALFFDGEDDFVEVPPLELGSEYTLSVWILPGEPKGGGYFNILSDDGNPVWGVREGNLKQYLFGRVEGSPVPRHEWTHLMLVRDGETHTLYVNGEQDETGEALAGDDVFSVIGAYKPVAGALEDREPFHGTIDDLLVYGTALSPDEAHDAHFFESLSLNEGLYLFYPLDGHADEEEEGKHGAVHGAEPGEDRFGEKGFALSFDGVDDHVQLPALELGSEYTLSVWVRPEEEKGGGYFNVLSNNGDPVWGVREGNLNPYLFGRVEGSPVERHEWTQLVIVRDGESHTLFKNGELDATANAPAGNDVYSVIGAYMPGAAEMDDREPFHGTIDDLIIWERALSGDEVFLLHDLTRPGPHEEAFVPIVRTGSHEEEDGAYVFDGQILTDGGAPILEAGIVLSTSIMGHDPIRAPAQLMGETLEFSVSLSGLEPGVRYYYRAYAANEVGENLGSLKKLVTREDDLPGAWWRDMPAVGGGWRASGWFGEFRRFEQTNWIYHAKLGWAFVVPDEERGLWLWQEEHGWLWTREGVMPYLWRHRSGNWLYLYGKFGGTPVFYDFE